jgi:hypothetical protein
MSADQPSTPSHRGLRRLGGGLIALAIGLGAVVLLVMFLNSRDNAHVDQATTAQPGQAFDAPQQYLGPEQLRLLRAGDVFLLYGGARAPAPLVALRDQLSGPPDEAIEAAGQAVILVRRAGADGVVALGGERILRTADPADPALEQFASQLLGASG